MGCDGFLLGGKDHSQSCIRIRKIVGIQSRWKLNDWVTEVVLKKLWNMKFCDMMTCASCGNALCSLSGFASHCLVREMDHGMQTMQAEHNIENTSRQTQYKTMSHILYRPHYWKISSFLSNSTLKLLKTLNTVQQILKSTHSPPSKKKKWCSQGMQMKPRLFVFFSSLARQAENLYPWHWFCPCGWEVLPWMQWLSRTIWAIWWYLVLSKKFVDMFAPTIEEDDHRFEKHALPLLKLI